MIPAIPTLSFDNRSGFAATQFDTLDQYGTPFHVIVAKTGYALAGCDADGLARLVALEEPAQLAFEDEYFDDDPALGVRRESDLAPYKPLCDVIVNAPRGRPLARFDVALRVRRPDRPAPLPERPQGLNQFAQASDAELEVWQGRLVRARTERIAGDAPIDKTLMVTGERDLRKMIALARLPHAGVALATLGGVRLNPWLLTAPEPFLRLPMRYRVAVGGECRIDAGEAAARRVAKKHLADAGPTAAHDACETNPLGRGFARDWYLDATKTGCLPAPRIEYAAAPFAAGNFWACAGGGELPEPAGLGFVGRAWLHRRALVGEVKSKDRWGEDEVPGLPVEFDFRYWNGAPQDQQCTLVGDEVFTLINLCPHDSPLARADAQGDTVLRFALPRQALFVLAVDAAARVAVDSCVVDTVLIDLEAGRVELTWRLRLPTDCQLRQARLMHAAEPAQLERLKAIQNAFQDTPQPPHPPGTPDSALFSE